jgi:peptide/nickel transport system ATP-binding protein
MPLLEVAGLSIDVEGERVIEELSFMVARGDRFGIVGEKGRDKTLIALALAGLLPRNARRGGQIRFDGKELPASEGAMARLRGSRIGVVFADPHSTILPRTTIASQLVALVRRARRDAVPGIEVPRVLGEVGLTEKDGERRIGDLTPEAAQRAAVALAIAGNPALLIAHEPAAGLDLISGRRIIDLIADVAVRRGLALVYVSDNLRAVAAVCGRVMIIDGGRIVEAGKVSSVFGHPREPYTKRLIASAKPVIRTLARPPTGSALLEVRGLTQRYGRKRPALLVPAEPVIALDDVSFSVGAMESVALIGPAGAGKSTLARIIAGLERADEGDLMFERTSYHGSPMPRTLRREISLVFENSAESFDPRRTLGDSIGEALGLERSLVAAARKERIAEALFAVGLSTDLMGRRPGEFSSGQLQRFAIARALVTRPRLIVFDEPVKALDVASRGEILALLSRLRSDLGLTYLIIGDDPDSVGVIADRVLIMDQGKVVEAGRPGELLHNPKHPVTQDIIAARLPQLTAVLAVER